MLPGSETPRGNWHQPTQCHANIRFSMIFPGMELIEGLQNHQNDQIYQHASVIIDKYFSNEVGTAVVQYSVLLHIPCFDNHGLSGINPGFWGCPSPPLCLVRIGAILGDPEKLSLRPCSHLLPKH